MTSSSNPLHLVHIVDLRVIGGVERMTEAFVLSLPQYQHSLIVFDRVLHPTLQASLQHLPNVRIYSSKHWGSLRLPKSWRTWRRNQIVAQLQPDAVINWSQIVDVGGIKQPVVFYEHGSAWEVFSQAQLSACYDSVHHCVAVSHAAKRMLQLHHGVTKPITIVTNTALEQPAVQTEARAFPAQRRLILGAAGRLVSRKNLMVLIAAVAALKQQGIEVGLDIAGNGPQKEVLQQLIEQWGVQEQVRLLDYVQDMKRFYAQIDLFVCPSIWESYGLVAIEAFAHGLPVIGAASDGLVEVVTHGVNGLVIEPTWDEQTYAQYMHKPVSFDATVSYRPAQDQIDAAKSVSVDGLVQAIKLLQQDAVLYESMSQAALKTAWDIKPFATLVAQVMDSVKEAIHD
ncbi:MULTISPECIES: glycosyltransferase family 4 protein [Vitreoscilla]|uniref:Glycosyltransferase family 4 protein n=1 Tax=Vitreoscilla stercoraria TaxID=61 RepID=A0ABY4E9V6_VITST|nr:MULTISPECIES: glycosyltransferase family 4 protein [Vitreoscilla]AUZ06093.1 group 1 glycosyl transferase [Vitreoscilla sp. C1]UOO92543.1 glycosyltransferase family 4 protein [Vitreoscilla stercoraria]